jgi:hypothetical protein
MLPVMSLYTHSSPVRAVDTSIKPQSVAMKMGLRRFNRHVEASARRQTPAGVNVAHPVS